LIDETAPFAGPFLFLGQLYAGLRLRFTAVIPAKAGIHFDLTVALFWLRFLLFALDLQPAIANRASQGSGVEEQPNSLRSDMGCSAATPAPVLDSLYGSIEPKAESQGQGQR